MITLETMGENRLLPFLVLAKKKKEKKILGVSLTNITAYILK